MWSGTLWVTFTRLCPDSLLSCPFRFGQTCHKSHLQSVIFYFFAAISEISFPVAKVDVLHASSHLWYAQMIHSGRRMSQPLPSIKKALGLDSSSHRGMLKLSEAYPHELVASLVRVQWSFLTNYVCHHFCWLKHTPPSCSHFLCSLGLSSLFSLFAYSFLDPKSLSPCCQIVSQSYSYSGWLSLKLVSMKKGLVFMRILINYVS
jgi:hypothetical protein